MRESDKKLLERSGLVGDRCTVRTYVFTCLFMILCSVHEMNVTYVWEMVKAVCPGSETRVNIFMER